jgi:hypothetical protein
MNIQIPNWLNPLAHLFKEKESAEASLAETQPPLEKPSPIPLERADLGTLAQQDERKLPQFVRESAAAMKYLRLFGELDWANFPEKDPSGPKRGKAPAPRAPFVAAFLIKLEKGLKSMPKLREHLVENPPLVWILGFKLVPSDAYSWGFDADASLSQARHFSRVMRKLRPDQTKFVFKCTVQLVDRALPAEANFGDDISGDTKHILAWVRENNLKEKVEDRYDKTKQPKGDPDCKVGCKKRVNKKEAPGTPEVHDGSDKTPTQEGTPASKAKVGVFYWGYGSGVVATKVGQREFVLAELTQTFDKSDESYFHPLMAETEENLGRKPRNGTFDGAFDAFYVYEYFEKAGGFAAIPWSDRADHKKTFSEEGLPHCQAGLAMPLRNTFNKKSGCMVPHQCARFACPLLFPEKTGEACPIDHAQWPKGGCITTLPTSPGNKIRHELDRESDEYKQLYNQRSATERINSQAVDLGIERPKLRNKNSIANNNTLTYVLINLRSLQKLRAQQAAEQAANNTAANTI